jgi:thymidylate synthase (FAD)
MLPVNIYSRMFATVDLHNLFGFLRLRLDEHAQFEIQEYARALLQLVRPICPVAVGAFEKGRGHE